MLHPSYNYFTTERICAPLCQQVLLLPEIFADAFNQAFFLLIESQFVPVDQAQVQIPTIAEARNWAASENVIAADFVIVQGKAGKHSYHIFVPDSTFLVRNAGENGICVGRVHESHIKGGVF